MLYSLSLPGVSSPEVFNDKNGYFCFEVRHLFGPTYCDTINELNETYKLMIDWLNVNLIGSYELSPMDNAAFSDSNEDY